MPTFLLWFNESLPRIGQFACGGICQRQQVICVLEMCFVSIYFCGQWWVEVSFQGNQGPQNWPAKSKECWYKEFDGKVNLEDPEKPAHTERSDAWPSWEEPRSRVSWIVPGKKDLVLAVTIICRSHWLQIDAVYYKTVPVIQNDHK